MIQIKVLTLALMLSSPATENVPFNQYIEIGLKTENIEISRILERNNGISSYGEDLRLSYKTFRGTRTTLEHFRNTGSDINIQTIRTRYWIFGSEIIYKDFFKNEPRYLSWIGFRHVFKRLTIGLNYSTDFNSERFSKSEIELSFLKNLKKNWFLKPSFKRKTIQDGSNKKSNWRFTINFEWFKK